MSVDACTPIGATSCCFAGRAAAIAVRGEGAAVFATPEALSGVHAARVDLVGARIDRREGPELSVTAPKLLVPLPMSLDGQAYAVTYRAGTPLRIVLDLPRPASEQGSNTTFLGELAGAPGCAIQACPVTWNDRIKTVNLVRAGGDAVELTGAFPFGGGDPPGRITEIMLEAATGTLRCKTDEGTRDEAIHAERLVWKGGADGALTLRPVRLEGDTLAIALQSSAPPARSAIVSERSALLAVAGGALLGLLALVVLLVRLRRRRRGAVVLHLSDLHFGTADDAINWSSQLVADLRNNLGGPRVDAVILSGDIANLSTPDEYAAARAFVEKLRAELHLTAQQVIPVPGNHDLDWGRSRLAYPTVAGAAPREGIDFEEGGAVHVRDDAMYPRRFEPFADFYEAVRGEPYPLDPARQAIVYTLRDARILVLGLNSAHELDHHFRARAAIHAAALSNALDRIRGDAASAGFLRIAVWHHPVHSAVDDRITDHGFLQRLADDGFRLGLHGHVHKADNALYRYDVGAGGRRIEIVTAGTFGAPVREWVPGFPLQYQLLRFVGATLTVETRRREEPNGAWQPDARWTPASGRDPRSRYTRSLA